MEALTDPDVLAALVGPVESIERQALGSVGYSGASHERLDVLLCSGRRRSLVAKHVSLAGNWTAYRTRDTVGREAALLTEPALANVWEVFGCPYLAYAFGEGEVALLMEDLTGGLFPDVDAPLSLVEEDALLDRLASLHARFWNADALGLGWLNTLSQWLRVLGPSAGPEEATQRPAAPLFELVRRGWGLALGRLPEVLVAHLCRPPDSLAREYADLPRTLIHGDAKVANFARLRGWRSGKIAAFDWAWVGSAPCSVDLGWYLAVNAGRLARPKEDIVAGYRARLEARLGGTLPDGVWERLETLAVLTGALMLLWEKALALDGGSPRACLEWTWWEDELRRRLL